MLFHFKDQFPQLAQYWERFLPYQQRKEVSAKTVLQEEGKISQQYIFIEKGFGWCKHAILCALG